MLYYTYVINYSVHLNFHSYCSILNTYNYISCINVDNVEVEISETLVRGWDASLWKSARGCALHSANRPGGAHFTSLFNLPR